jgi:hypothetical protein
MDEKMVLRLYSLGNNLDFRVISNVEVSTTSEAKTVVEKHIENSGYTNLKTVDDEDYSLRFTATTPNGRPGRNVAALDF